MSEKKLCDYFVVSGLPVAKRQVLEDDFSGTLARFTSPSASSPTSKVSVNKQAPITDITVINTSLEEEVPEGYECILYTQLKYPANLNHGSINSPCMFLCFRRGFDKPPLEDIGVLYESKETVRPDSQIVEQTFYGTSANINNSTSNIYLTYRRAESKPYFNNLVVMDICVIFENKNEQPPHAFLKIDKNLNKGILGSNIYICYKKSLLCPPLIRYMPAIIDRYPKYDLDSYALPESTALFCLPTGCTVECWTRESRNVLPSTSTFVLTSNSAVKVYGTVLNYYEELSEQETASLNVQELQLLGFVSEYDRHKKRLQVKKSLCILSRCPFFEPFHRFLRFLYTSYVCQRSQSVPIELLISYFMHRVPLPSIQRPHILFQLGSREEDTIELSYSSEEMPLPLSGASFFKFLRLLEPEDSIIVFLLALLEQKILLHSLNLNFLTSVAEAITSLIFPFHWQCPYIPLCPLGLCDVLSAPMPFIVGVDSKYFDLHDPPADVICINLDTHNISMLENKRHLTTKLMPKRATRMLKSRLEAIYDEILLESERTEKMAQKKKGILPDQIRHFRKLDLDIQEAFLQFMATILKDLRSYLKPITKAPTVGATDPSSLFNFSEFLRSRERSSQPFYQLLMNTQMFTKFIEERSFVSDKDTSLAFFDECLNKVENDPDFESSFKFMHFADGKAKSDRTVFIPPPEPPSPSVELSKLANITKKIGPFNHSLFLKDEDLERHRKNDFFISNSLVDGNNSGEASISCPMSKRTKQEIRLAQQVAYRLHKMPLTWSKCLVGYCYTLWFVHLPSFIKGTSHVYSIRRQLDLAFVILLRVQSLSLHPLDEVCYRVLMLLCGVYNNPILAVKVLHEMKEHNVRPNAITYGYYNRAVLESKWPTDASKSSAYWSRLRNVVHAIAEFQKLGKSREKRASKGEVFTQEKQEQGDVFRKDLCLFKSKRTIVRTQSTEEMMNKDFSNEAGILMVDKRYVNYMRTGELARLRKNSKVEEQLFMNLTKTKVEEKTMFLPKGAYWRSYSLGQRAIQRFKEDNLVVLKKEFEQQAHLEQDEEDEDLLTTPYQESKDELDNPEERNLRKTSHFESVDSLGSENSSFLPIKGTIMNMNFFSPEGKVASTLRNSFRMAKSQLATNNLFKGNLPKSFTFQSSAELQSPEKKSEQKINRLVRSSTSDHTNLTPEKTSLVRSSTLSFPISPPNINGNQKVSVDSNHPLSSNLPDEEIDAENDSRSLSSEINTIWNNKQKHIDYLNSTFRSATNSMANRLNEIKTTFATGQNSPSRLSQNSQISQVVENTTAMLSNLANRVAEKLPSGLLEEDPLNLGISDVDGSRRASEQSVSSITDNHPKLAEDCNFFDKLEKYHSRPLDSWKHIPFLVNIQITSCSKCHRCQAIVYDEEIMDKWSPDDSNLNTVCPFCEEQFVPLLTIESKYYEAALKNPSILLKNTKKIDFERFMELKRMPPFTVAYISPIVLRKEVENILENEGDLCLASDEFVDEHPIIYWNLVWYFSRNNLPSHLPGLYLSNLRKQLLFTDDCTLDYRNVMIKCVWDNDKIHEDKIRPMFYLWRQKADQSRESKLIHALLTDSTPDSQFYLQELIGYIKEQKMHLAVRELLSKRFSSKSSQMKYSIYRDLLFLTFIAIGRENIDSLIFDREYNRAYDLLSTEEAALMQKIDRPPSLRAIFCRRTFKDLELKSQDSLFD